MDHDEHDMLESETKRKRLRKGTHSCWSCKRRKVRCAFASETDITCIACRRRDTKCISQELPEELNHTEESSDRINRVEALLNQLVKQVDPSSAAKDKDGAQSTSEDGRTLRPAAPTPVSDSDPCPLLSLNVPLQERPSRGDKDVNSSVHYSTPLRTPASQTSTTTTAAPRNAGKYEKVSQGLLAALPSHEDIDILLERGCGARVSFCHQVNVRVLSQVDRDGQDEIKLSEICNPRTHPVLLAKQMLLLSLTLLRLAPHEHIHGLAEHHHIIMERLADATISLVTTCEDLFGTMESLECILLEAFYHLDNGNIRRAWLAFRRAMVAAQLMGIHRPSNSLVKVIDPRTNLDPQFMWFRIVYMDRFLSLMVGLPHSDCNMSMNFDTPLANSTPSERLEGFHVVILAKMLERNELGPSQSAITNTLEIDAELLKAAESIPAKFWAPPNFAGLDKDSPEALEEAMRVRAQMVHYTILNQLHLPLLLCPGNDRKNEYSKITCVSSSREILTRFVAFRTFNRISAYCRLADFLALVAGMTLILAHIYSHRNKENGNFLAHQRLGDRATVEQALENMELSSELKDDMLGARCANLLQHLLHVEANAAREQISGADKVQRTEGSQEECTVLFVTVPYFGTVRIARDGVTCSPLETSRISSRNTQDLGGNFTIGGIGSVRISSQTQANNSDQQSPNIPGGPNNYIDFGDLSPQVLQRPAQTQTEELHTVSEAGQLPSAVFAEDFMPQQDLYPNVAASMNDWVFQGVDTAFFDNLIKGTNLFTNDSCESTDWTQNWNCDPDRQ